MRGVAVQVAALGVGLFMHEVHNGRARAENDVHC